MITDPQFPWSEAGKWLASIIKHACAYLWQTYGKHVTAFLETAFLVALTIVLVMFS